MIAKIVSFICAAGASSSFMSIMSIADSLMLDFRCLINPRFVYSIESDFDKEKLINLDIQARLETLVTKHCELVTKLTD